MGETGALSGAVICDLPPDMVAIAGGRFLMGCDSGQENESPVHSVWLDAFAIARFPVTRRQYAQFLAATRHPEPSCWREAMFADPRQPVVGVSWHDAVQFCRWWSECCEEKIRLPTEAEWERAARGGLEGKRYPWGDESPEKQSRIGCDRRNGGPLPVGANEPNGFGLYDMSEGVHEWCSDWYDYNYYRTSPERNPGGAASGTRRSSRGGSWRHRIPFSRCAARSSLPPEYRYADYGFRVAMTIR